MYLTFAPKGILQIDDARICHKNFAGKAGQYNREGDRSFSLVIPDPNIAEDLMNDVNKDGVGWNVKIKPPYEEGDTAFMYLPVKVRFNEWGPNVWLISGKSRQRLDENSVGRLDKIRIAQVNLDIAPSDSIVQGRPYRTAYLRSIEVIQDLGDRFAARWEDEDDSF